MATAVKPQTDRRTQLLDAALRLVAREGLRSLTHRAVEAEAGVPHGSTTYYFGSRYELLAALINRMHELDKEKVEPIAHKLTLMLADRSRAPRLDAIIEEIVAWVESDIPLQMARYEMQVAGARDPELKTLMTGCASVFWRMSEPIAVAAGSKDPARDARLINSVLDGLILDYLTHDGADSAMISDGMMRLLGSFERGGE